MADADVKHERWKAATRWVRVDEKVLQRNLADAGRQMTSEEIHEWLREEGWQRGKDGLWLVDTPSLEILDAREYEVVEHAM